MERACLSMRRATVFVFANPPLAIDSTFSIVPFKPPPISLLSPTRRCLSTTSCALHSPPSVSIHDETTFPFPPGAGVVEEKASKKQLLKGMRYAELQSWVQSHGFRPGQAMMLWKRLYGDSIWAQHSDELEGLNRDFKKMLSKDADFMALSLKDVLTASDGTKKELTDFIHNGRWNGD